MIRLCGSDPLDPIRENAAMVLYDGQSDDGQSDDGQSGCRGDLAMINL
jgi:hypothetical protein